MWISMVTEIETADWSFDVVLCLSIGHCHPYLAMTGPSVNSTNLINLQITFCLIFQRLGVTMTDEDRQSN